MWSLHALVVGGIDNIVGQIDKQLGEATFGGSVVPEY